MKHVLAICTLIFVLSSVRIAYGQATPSPYTDADAYAVYSVVMEGRWPIQDAKAKKLVIQTETADYRGYGDQTICLKPAEGEEAIYGPVIAAYGELNKKRLLLQPKFDLTVPYQLVTKASIDEIFAKKGINGWTDFYAKYPDSGGVISMSAVGFNADKTIAIVYMGRSWCGLCGGGGYHVLQKTTGKWSEIKWNGTSCSWVS